jgi:hypothetical protein
VSQPKQERMIFRINCHDEIYAPVDAAILAERQKVSLLLAHHQTRLCLFFTPDKSSLNPLASRLI